MLNFIISWKYIHRYNISAYRLIHKYILETKKKECRTKENEYIKSRVNSFFDESFKLFQNINFYLSSRKFCCEITHA